MEIFGQRIVADDPRLLTWQWLKWLNVDIVSDYDTV